MHLTWTIQAKIGWPRDFWFWSNSPVLLRRYYCAANRCCAKFISRLPFSRLPFHGGIPHVSASITIRVW